MAVSVQIVVNEQLYLRDPQESKLGKKIIGEGILLIDEIGLEKARFGTKGSKDREARLRKAWMDRGV